MTTNTSTTHRTHTTSTGEIATGRLAGLWARPRVKAQLLYAAWMATTAVSGLVVNHLLPDGVLELTTTQGWRRYLRAMATLRTYSSGNSWIFQTREYAC